VGTPAGGIPDALHDGENGCLVPVNDAPALAAALDTLLADDSLRARLGRAARATVQRDFALARELRLNLEIYGRITG
jgi:glycosyltransferase involved in cell wall biosynthesis